jgi:ABC-type transport system involved in multi-copper enzyme maturation permease subunit
VNYFRSIGVIGINTYREVIRDRILYGIVVFALLLIGLSVVLGGLSFTEQAKISADFGFAGIQIGASILSIFVGSTLVAKEIDKQTILTLLARPITRTQFILGKFAGLLLVILTVMFGLAAVLAGLLLFLGLQINGLFFVALFGVVLEALVLVSCTLMFGVISRPIMTVIFASSVFLLGHWVSSLEGLMKLKSIGTDPMYQAGAKFAKIIPNLERFNWRSAPIYNIDVPLADLAYATVYALGWMIIFLALTSFIFRRRDFV